MRRTVILVAVAMAWAAVFLVGCKSSGSPIFFTSPGSPYPDVPVPAGFTLVNQSGSSAGPAAGGGGARNMEYLYQSSDGLQPMAQFFSDKLPKQGWVLQGQTQGSGRVLMKFAKGAEVLQIELWSSSMIRTNARLRISPAPSGPATQG